MAVMLLLDVPGGTAAQYEQVLAGLAAAGASEPAGRLEHMAAPTPRGWLVVDIWDAPADLEAFVPTLLPLLAAAGLGAVEPQVYPLHARISSAVASR